MIDDRSASRAAYAAHAAAVEACQRCPRMAGRRRVAGQGPLDARVLFVAEAPGRLGAERSGIPLTLDRSGRAFELLLAAAGWRREEVFVSNAVRCTPRDGRGRNAPPSAAEIAACSAHLRDLLLLLQPPWVVSLGAVALRALALIAPHGARLARDVGRPLPWYGRTLVPLYHPGPRARRHRSLAAQLEDFRRLRALVDDGREELRPATAAGASDAGESKEARRCKEPPSTLTR